MKSIKYIFSICSIVLLIGCTSTQVLKDKSFAMFDEDFVQTFDKAQGVKVTFVANYINDMKPRIEFRGNSYQPEDMSSIHNGNQMKRYTVNIPGPIEQGDYTVTLKHGSGEEEVTDELSLKVYPTKLQTIKLEDEGVEFSLEDEMIGLIKSLSKGDALEFSVLPSSGTSIPLNQFRILTKGFTKSSPILGTSVASYNGYNVALDADRVGVKLVWIDPSDQENIVQIAPTDGSEYIETVPALKRPRIVCGDISRITDENNPVFMISCEVKAPLYEDSNMSINDVTFEIKETSVKGYKATPIGQPQLLNGKWTMGFKLIGTLPIPKGIGGSFKISVKAAAMAPNGEKSSVSTRSCKFNVVY